MRLRKECEHGRWDEHWQLQGDSIPATRCPGGEFLPEGTLVADLTRCAHGEMTYEDFRIWADQWLAESAHTSGGNE